MVRDRLPRVLIIDDQPVMARSMARVFDGEAEVTMAGSGDDALALIECGERFDLVLCDVMMPNMTGLELFDRVRETHPDVAAAFVFATGGIPPEHRAKLDSTGVRCLFKPCPAHELRGLLRSSEV
jgi:CheY-like chemotaxis protein